MSKNDYNSKFLESWIWDAATSIRGAEDAWKNKDCMLPLTFAKWKLDPTPYKCRFICNALESEG